MSPRPGGQWSADDYDVFERDQHDAKLVGSSMQSPQASAGNPWFWTITARVPRNGLISNYIAHLARAAKILADNNKTPTESRAYLAGSAGKYARRKPHSRTVNRSEFSVGTKNLCACK